MFRFKEKTAAELWQLLSVFPNNAFASPLRSTIPLLEYWREPEVRLAEWCANLQQSVPETCELVFEYRVPVRRGKGKASYTDLMILGDQLSVAIEAKYLEPAYETVAEWLGVPEERNRSEVLDGWLELLHEAGDCQLERNAARALPYQFIHRAASAAFTRRKHVFLVYQIFDERKTHFYQKQLETCHAAIHPSVLQVALACTPFKPTARYDALVARWKARDRAGLSHEIVRSMEDGPLLSFGPLSMTVIRGPNA